MWNTIFSRENIVSIAFATVLFVVIGEFIQFISNEYQFKTTLTEILIRSVVFGTIFGIFHGFLVYKRSRSPTK